MKLNELKAIIFKSASNAMKNEGEELFNRGLVTYFKGKKIGDIYHVYGKVTDKNKIKEFNTHIKIDLQKKMLEGAKCSCDEFKEFASNGYTLMCSHITATSNKLFSLLSKGHNETREDSEKSIVDKYKIWGNTETTKLIRKTEKESEYYEVLTASRNEKLIIKPNELRRFLEGIENRKIKFKFEHIEFTVPIFHKDMPITFNLKDDKERIILSTHKQLPILLNSNNDAYYFKNELYLPSKSQCDNYATLHEKLKAYGEIVYSKNIKTYIELISILSSITENINISESLRNLVSNSLKVEFLVFEDGGRIYCDSILNYGGKRVNILNKNSREDNFIRDNMKEEKLLLEMEKSNFIKMKNKFMFTGGDEELFDLLKGVGDSIEGLGKITLGNGISNQKIYTSEFIKANLFENSGEYNFSYNIGNLELKELNSAFEAYRSKNRFYKTRNNDFLDFEDDNVREFFKLLEALNIDQNLVDGSVKVEKSKALYLYENIVNKGLGSIKGTNELNDIEKKLANINSRKIFLPDDFVGELREYQMRGFKWFKTISELGFGGILADEMGLGKTIQTIAFLLSEKSKRSLIVCPTSLIYNWKEEFQKFAPSLNILIVHGAQRIEEISNSSNYDVILTTYGTLRSDINYYEDISFDYCIIDEGQNIKNASAQNTKVIKEIKAKIKFALTGTPIENNLTELWSIFDFVMPGYLYSKEVFQEKFISKGEENLESLKILIKPFILRRTKNEVMKELPDKVEKKLLVEMTAAQKGLYSNYVKRVKAKMKDNNDKRIEILSYLTKLRQICLDPSLILEDYDGGSGKLELAIELIKEHIETGNKVLLFSQFTSALDKIGERLNKEEINFFHLQGKTKPKDRIKLVKEFNSSEVVKVFLISLKAGGTGLNLTSANLVIHFDPWWNPAVEDQATDRAHRIGQEKEVEVIRLVAKGTIEEKIILLQEDKKELINDILTGELQNSSLLSSLSKDDLMQLFDR
ncbi:DEAD/DEAH box helicase [Clostridium saccharoperbutylacetonicum]|uniref:DEAD/DEAH box helicase n=1 Tax=Clostridium saccharoperbutylacetonicum TaxID=36745 RepID=UPI000983A257|nr:SNF2-related protein [Clostridium saccharoperbutylacetonicum]AQR97262.1 RNA polymerase-associated protein RapA [Clostridium saccharoperbutylacetonicum]NSB33144.1 SNF2 family DNA or RNA helicase [Clostridium saccharoperbutylacetonicum]